jgi:uncharacterized membrane protein (DUF4010 family)
LTYLVQRYRPMKGDALLPALLGGAYSSTATTVVLAKRQKETRTRRPELSAGIIAATAVMYPRLLAVIAFFSVPLAVVLLPGVGFLFAAGAAISWWEWKKIEPGSTEDMVIPAANPLQLTTALIFAMLFLAVSLVTAWVGSAFGQTGVFTLAALVGASDIDPFVLNLAQGGVPDMRPSAVAAAVLIAASANKLANGATPSGLEALPPSGRRSYSPRSHCSASPQRLLTLCERKGKNADTTCAPGSGPNFDSGTIGVRAPFRSCPCSALPSPVSLG